LFTRVRNLVIRTDINKLNIKFVELKTEEKERN
jgi:hypothetical protein